MTTTPGSPADRLLTASLFFAPVLYLLADGLYALRGWDSPAAGVVHVLAAIAYAFVFLRVTGWTTPALAAALLVVSQIGVAALVWPVAHIANIGWLAVLVNLALVAGFGLLATTTAARTPVTATA